MIRRVAVILGLLAFCITILGGLVRQNSIEYTLGRALWAMGCFCLIGLGVGWAAQHVVREHRAKQFEEVFGYAEGSPPSADDQAADSEGNNSTPTEAHPIQS